MFLNYKLRHQKLLKGRFPLPHLGVPEKAYHCRTYAQQMQVYWLLNFPCYKAFFKSMSNVLSNQQEVVFFQMVMLFEIISHFQLVKTSVFYNCWSQLDWCPTALCYSPLQVLLLAVFKQGVIKTMTYFCCLGVLSHMTPSRKAEIQAVPTCIIYLLEAYFHC